MAKIHIENGIISSSADYSLYHGTSEIAKVEEGGLRVQGDVTAENLIISSSVTYMTQSFSSGSTIFGDDVNDTHQFTGSVFIKGQGGGVGESLTLGSYADGATQIMIRSNGASNPNIRIERGSSGNNFSIQNNGALNILRNSSALMTVHYLGNIGINETSPDEKLHVGGNILATGNITGSNLLLTGSSAVPKFTFDRAGARADIFMQSAGLGLVIDAATPIQLDYTTALTIEKEGTEFWRFTGNGGLAFGDSSSSTSVLTIKSDSHSPISFEKSSNRQNYLEFKKTSGNLTQPWLIGVDTDATGTEFRVKNGSMTALTITSGSGNTTINDISITSDNNHRTISKGAGAGAFNFTNTGQNHDIRFFVNSGGVITKALEIEGLTKALLPGADTGMNLGLSSTRWHTVHATNFTAHGGNISGSATSTGSFGHLTTVSSIGIGTTNVRSALTIKEGVLGGNAEIRFDDTDDTLLGKIGVARTTNEIINGTANLDLAIRLYDQNSDLIIGKGATEVARIDGMNGSYSGSASSTGSFGAVTIGPVPSDDVDHPLEVEGNMRISGDIYGFSTSPRGFQRKRLSFGFGTDYFTGGVTHEYNHVFKDMNGNMLFHIGGDGAKVSGSSSSTGSFGRLVVGRGNTNTSADSTTGGSLAFGVDGGISTDRIILKANAVEIGDYDYFTGNVFTKGSVGGFTADPTLFIQKGLQIMGYGNNRGISINAGNADKKTFIVAQAGGMDLHDFYIANARAGRRIKMQVVSGSTLTDTLTLTTGSDSNVMVELGGNISGSSSSTGSFGAIQIPGSNDNGIGIHIHDGGIFGASANPNPSARGLLIESTTNTGMTIHSGGGSARSGIIAFSATDRGHLEGVISYSHVYRRFQFDTEDVTSFTMGGGTSGILSGSATSTGSFGRVQATKVHAGDNNITTNSLRIQTTSRFFGVSGNSINMTANGSAITSGAYNIIVGRLNIGHTYSIIDFGRHSVSGISYFRVQHHVSEAGTNPWGILNPQYQILSMFNNSGSLFLNYGDVSGSSTSTGSFGRVKSDFINIGGNANRTAGTTDTNLWISGSDANGVSIILDNANGTANRKRVKMGFVSNVWSLKTVLDGGAESTQHFGVNTYNSSVSFAGAVSGITNLTTTGNITAGGNVSGSADSTGSFGSVTVGVAEFGGGIADSVHIGLLVANGENSKIRIARNNSLNNYLDIVGGTQGGIYNINSSATNAHIFKTSNTERVRINEHGLGINATPTNNNRLMVKADTNDDGISLFDASDNRIFKVFQQSTDVGRMMLRGNGQIVIDLGDGADESFIDLKQLGIGNKKPSAALDVSGSVRISGSLEVNTHTNGETALTIGGVTTGTAVTPTMNFQGAGQLKIKRNNSDILVGGDGASDDTHLYTMGTKRLTIKGDSGDVEILTGNISGSSTSTGSFAKGFIADGLTIGGDNTFIDSKLNVTDGHIRLDNLKKLHWAGTNNGIRGTSSGYLEFITGNQVRQKVGSGTTTHYQNVRLTDTINFGSETYTTGFGGEGYRIGLDSANRYEAEFDNLFVRGRMTVFELLINQIRASNGAVYVSDAAKVESVTSVNATTFHLNFDTGSGYGHPFQQDDLLKAQRFNGSGVYLSRMTVTGIAGTNGLTASLFTGDTPPSGGFEFVRVGSTSDTDRQGAIYLTNSDNGAPFMDVYDGVDSHVFPTGSEYLKVRVGKLDGVSSPTLTIPSSTYGFYASGSAFLEGTINATAGGFIGGWNINASTIEKVNSNGGVRLDSSNKRIDFLSNASTTRLRVGQVDSNKFGIRGFNTAGNRVFEISEVRNEIAGWSIQETVISSSDGNVQIDAGNSRFLIKSGTAERVRMGLLNNNSQYGISGSDENGNLLFKLGDAGNEIAGWEIAQGLLRYDNASGSIALDASNQNISIHTGSINTAKPKVVMGNLPTTGGQRYGFAVFSGSANADINNDDTYSVLITRDKARLAGWDLVPGRLKSGTVADINGNQASIALGGGSGGTNALNAGATPTSNLFFVSASSSPIFYVGENFSYVNDTLTAAGWTLNSDGFSDASDNIQLSSTHASMSLGQKLKLIGGTDSYIASGDFYTGGFQGFDNESSGFILGVDGSDTKFELGDGDQGNNFLRFSSAGNGSIDIGAQTFTFQGSNLLFTNSKIYLGTIISNTDSSGAGFFADSSGNVRIFKDSDNFITFGSSGMNITTERLNLTATNLTASSDSEFLHLGPPTRVDGNNWESSTGAFFSGSGEFRIASGSNSIQYSKANNAVTMNFANFSVDAQGKISATDGTFSGDISATSGFFGNTAGLGWVIDGNTIKNASGSIFLNANPAQTSIGVSNTGGTFIGEIVPDYSSTSDIFSSGTAYIDTSIPTTAVTIGSDALGGMTRTASTDLFIYYTNATTAVVGTSLGNEADLTVGVNYRATVVIEITIFVNTPNYAQSNYTLMGNAVVGGTLNFRKQSIDLSSVSLARTIIGDSFGSGTTLRSFTYTKTIIHDFEASATAEYNAEVLDFSVTNNGIQERYTTFIGEGKPPIVSTIDTTIDATSKVVYTDFTLQPSSKKTQMAPGGFQTVNMANATLENSSNSYFRTDVEQGQAFNAMGTGHFTGSFSLKPLGGGANNKISISGREITIHEVDSTTQSGLAFLHGSNTFRPIVTIEHPTITTDRFNAVLALKRGDTAKDRAHIQFWKGNTFEWACGTAYNGGSVTDEFHISQHDAESNGAYSAGTSALRIDTNDMTHLINLSIYNTNNSTEEAARFVSAGPASTIPVVSIAQQEGDGAMVNGTILLDLDYTNDSSIGSSNDYIRFQDGGGEVGRIHSEVSYGTFTGAHISQRPSGSNFSNWKKGMLLKSTGNILVTGSMSKAWPEVDLVTTQKDKAIMGVFVETGSAPADNPKYDEMVASGSRHTGVISGFNPTLPSINYNALGEGLIRVTDTNGNIETGDYICSSNRTGHGEKQDDDLLHNYTVAKATQPIDFSNVSVDSDLGYKSVLIACTYHCG